MLQCGGCFQDASSSSSSTPHDLDADRNPRVNSNRTCSIEVTSHRGSSSSSGASEGRKPTSTIVHGQPHKHQQRHVRQPWHLTAPHLQQLQQRELFIGTATAAPQRQQQQQLLQGSNIPRPLSHNPSARHRKPHAAGADVDVTARELQSLAVSGIRTAAATAGSLTSKPGGLHARGDTSKQRRGHIHAHQLHAGSALDTICDLRVSGSGVATVTDSHSAPA